MNYSFITSYLTFYLKATVAIDGNFIKVSSPNTILKLIPLGSENKSIPVSQVSAVHDSFKLSIGSLIWGIIVTLYSFSAFGNSFVWGLIMLAYGVTTILSSFQTILVLEMPSGNVDGASVIVFEKAKLQQCKADIEALINQRYADTNVTANTDRVINAINNK